MTLSTHRRWGGRGSRAGPRRSAPAQHERQAVAGLDLGKLVRQAKPDDVFTFATLAEIAARFPLVTRYLDRSCDFWTWLLGFW